MSQPLNTDSYVIQRENLLTHDSEEETLIYDLNRNKAFCLNHTSAIVWRFCNGKNSISDISKNLSNHFNIPVDEDFVWLTLDQLQKKELVKNVPKIPAELSGLSRRDIIKKIGLGTMIALPVISSLIAPPAIHAVLGYQSGSRSSLYEIVAMQQRQYDDRNPDHQHQSGTDIHRKLLSKRFRNAAVWTGKYLCARSLKRIYSSSGIYFI